jgi:hypothetical protein
MRWEGHVAHAGWKRITRACRVIFGKPQEKDGLNDLKSGARIILELI